MKHMGLIHNIYSMSIVKKLNSWPMDETQNFNCQWLTPVGGVQGDVSTDHKSDKQNKLSQLVQKLFHLSDLKLQVWLDGGWVVVCGGRVIHAKHANLNCKWLSPLGG